MTNLKSAARWCVAAAAAVTLAAQPAHAQQTTSANLNVTATVAPACRVSTTPVAFGTIDVTRNIAFSATGTFTATCTTGTTWQATASAGGGTNATYLGRSMTSADGLSALNYNLFTDSAHGIAWTDSSGMLGQIFGTGTGAAQINTVYAEVGAAQTTVPAGEYSDTVIVTLTY